MKFIKLIFFTLLVFLTFQYCSLPEGPYACTGEFVMHSLTVIGPNETPADSVQITVSNKENEKAYPCDEYLCRERQTGAYIIMHDGLREKIDDRRETIIVEGTKGNLQFKEEFDFRGGECHVKKIAGPDTVSLSSN